MFFFSILTFGKRVIVGGGEYFGRIAMPVKSSTNFIHMIKQSIGPVHCDAITEVVHKLKRASSQVGDPIFETRCCYMLLLRTRTFAVLIVFIG